MARPLDGRVELNRFAVEAHGDELSATARYLRMAKPGHAAGAEALSLLSQLRRLSQPGSAVRRKEAAPSKAAARTAG